jgi:hypothetical protein
VEYESRCTFLTRPLKTKVFFCPRFNNQARPHFVMFSRCQYCCIKNALEHSSSFVEYIALSKILYLIVGHLIYTSPFQIFFLLQHINHTLLVVLSIFVDAYLNTSVAINHQHEHNSSLRYILYTLTRTVSLSLSLTHSVYGDFRVFTEKYVHCTMCDRIIRSDHICTYCCHTWYCKQAS